MSTEDLADVLAKLSLFADLTRPQLEAAAHTFEEEWFTEGQRILREGFSGTGFYIIVDGDAAVRLGGKDLARISRGDFFGEISILLGEAPTADVVALTALRCVTLPAGEVQAFLEANPKVMFRMLKAEANRLRSTLQWQS